MRQADSIRWGENTVRNSLKIQFSVLKAESFTQSSFFPTEFIYINVFNVKTSISVKYLPNQRLWGGWLQKLYELLNIYLPWLCNAQRILGTWCICNVHWLFFVLELFFLCSLPLINFFAWNFLNSCTIFLSVPV